jgi:hypothetical protein
MTASRTRTCLGRCDPGGRVALGKTPTSLYLAMQYGIKAANYPLIPDDFERGKLPSSLYEFKQRSSA